MIHPGISRHRWSRWRKHRAAQDVSVHLCVCLSVCVCVCFRVCVRACVREWPSVCIWLSGVCRPSACVCLWRQRTGLRPNTRSCVVQCEECQRADGCRPGTRPGIPGVRRDSLQLAELPAEHVSVPQRGLPEWRGPRSAHRTGPQLPEQRAQQKEVLRLHGRQPGEEGQARWWVEADSKTKQSLNATSISRFLTPISFFLCPVIRTAERERATRWCRRLSDGQHEHGADVSSNLRWAGTLCFWDEWVCVNAGVRSHGSVWRGPGSAAEVKLCV